MFFGQTSSEKKIETIWVIWKAKYNIQIKKYFKCTVEGSFCGHALYKHEVDVDLLLIKLTTIKMHHIQNKISLFEYIKH